GYVKPYDNKIDWDDYEAESAVYNWDLSEEDLQFSIPIGLKLKNDIIMNPYPVGADITVDSLPNTTEDAFLLLLDRYGKWRVDRKSTRLNSSHVSISYAVFC